MDSRFQQSLRVPPLPLKWYMEVGMCGGMMSDRDIDVLTDNMIDLLFVHVTHFSLCYYYITLFFFYCSGTP